MGCLAMKLQLSSFVFGRWQASWLTGQDVPLTRLTNELSFGSHGSAI